MLNPEDEEVRQGSENREHWDESATSEKCMVCEWEFPMVVRWGGRHHSPFIHHCRFCGCAVCGPCSERGLMSRKFHGIEERACDLCWTRHQDNILDLDDRLARIESEGRMAKKIQATGSLLHREESLVKVFALDGTSLTVPVNEKTTAISLSRAALELFLKGAPSFDCGLWQTESKLERLQRLDDQEVIANVLARWRLKDGSMNAAKLVIPIQPTRKTVSTTAKKEKVLEQIAIQRREEAIQRRLDEFPLKGKSVVVRIADWLEVDNELAKYALGHDGRLARVAGQVSSGDLVTFDNVVTDAKCCAAVIAGKSLDSFVLTGNGKRLTFTAENAVVARRWRDEVHQVHRVQDIIQFELFEDLIAALAAQKSRFQAAGVQLDAAEAALRVCSRDLDTGLLDAVAPPTQTPAPDLIALAASLFDCNLDMNSVDDGMAPLREDARCAAVALLDLCAETAGRARRFADCAHALLARTDLEPSVQDTHKIEKSTPMVRLVENDDDDDSGDEDLMASALESSITEKVDEDQEKTIPINDNSAWLLASAQKGLCTTINHDDLETEETPPVHYAVKDLEVIVSADAKGDTLLDALRPVARLGQGTFGATTITIASTQADKYTLYEVKATLKHEAVRLQLSNRLVAERQALTRLSGSSLCSQLMLAQSDANFLYLVLNFTDGGSLADLLPVSPKIARFYVASLGLALDHCHERAVVHRDLRPKNGRLTANGFCVLSNFHCAAVLDTHTQRLSTLCGVMAPECITGSYDYAVDWWALGRVALELVARSPFEDEEQDYSLILDAASGKFPTSTMACIKASGADYAALVTNLLANRAKRIISLSALQKHPIFSESFDDWASIVERTVTPPQCDLSSSGVSDLRRTSSCSSSGEDTPIPLSGFFSGNVVCFTGDNQLFQGF